VVPETQNFHGRGLIQKGNPEARSPCFNTEGLCSHNTTVRSTTAFPSSLRGTEKQEKGRERESERERGKREKDTREGISGTT